MRHIESKQQDSRFKSNHIKNEFKHKWFKKVNRKTECLDKWIWMAESLCCSPETITTLLISCTPVQNKKLKQKTKKQTVTWIKANPTVCYIHLLCLVTQMSDSLRPPCTAACQATLSTGILQARILAWKAYPFSRGSSDPGIELGSPALQVYSLPAELPGKPHIHLEWPKIKTSDTKCWQGCGGIQNIASEIIKWQNHFPVS